MHHAHDPRHFEIFLYIFFTQKSNKRMMVGTITREKKKEGQRKAQRCTTHKNQKKGKS
jgi:hypothetical protein